ncbi:MAG: nucleotidyltransferase domain-containing protein [Actinobacteria bacterium]|nr:nucleotidyltransferase domain-containing protein [Actinomycetota bacterium]
MRTAPTVAALTRSIRSTFEHDPRIVYAYAFGSTARGDATVDSDVDMAVYICRSTHRCMTRPPWSSG